MPHRWPAASVRSVNPAAQGKVYPAVRFVVEPARVAAFAGLFGQADGVPPTFAAAAEFTVLPQVVADPDLAIDFTRVLHGSQDYEHHRPMRVGETLTVTMRIESVKVKGANGFLTLLTQITDASDEPVCTARSSMVERGGPQV